MLKFTNEELLEVLPTNILESKELTTKQKTVLAQLIVYNGLEQSRNNGFFYRSNKDLCNDCGISEHTLITTVTKLETLGYINRKKGKRGVGASEYKITEGLLKNNNTENCSNNTENCSNNNTENCSNNNSNNIGDNNMITNELIEVLKEIRDEIRELRNTINYSNNYSNNCSTDTESDTEEETDKLSLFDNNLFIKEKNISVGYIERESDEIQIENNDIPMDKETNITEAHFESASAEDKTIPIEDKWLHHLVEPTDPLDELFAEGKPSENSLPSDKTQNKALGDVFSESVDNYEGQGEKSAQNALKVPQIESNDPDKVWTYFGSEYNGEKMTYQECVDRGLRYWCLQDLETGEFCTSEYILSISR